MSGPLLLAALTGLLLGALAARRALLSLGLTLAGCATGLAAALLTLAGTSLEFRASWTLGGQTPHLLLDPLSAWFLVVVCVLGGAGALYARDYWGDSEHPATAARGRVLWNLMLLSMSGVLLAANGLHFLLCWELFAILGWLLITLDNRLKAVRQAGWLYLGASHAGTLALFGFFALLARARGSWDLGPGLLETASTPLFVLMVFGFGIKAGFFPLHIWLPPAHANAPSHVSALLSGVAVKMGVYGLFRFSGWMPTPPGSGEVLMLLGAAGAVLGIALAATQNDLKRLLAYCTVENIGIILCGLGLALTAREQGQAALGALALMGALFHVWNHALFKGLLFFGAGSVLHATGTRRMSRLGGLALRMPVTAAAFLIGSLAVAGLPPLNGFASEWLLYRGLAQGLLTRLSGAAPVALLLLAMAGAIALAAFIKAAGISFLGAPRSAAASHAHEAAPRMRASMFFLGLLCLLAGIFPGTLADPLRAASGAWHPSWAELAAPHASLGVLPMVLTVLFALAIFLTLLLLRMHPRRRGLTWDCGYTAPTRRMQYSSGSFSELLGGFFKSLFRPLRRLRRPRKLLPREARLLEEQPDPVLDRLLAAATRPVLLAAAAMRALQHGRLNAYILYLFIGLAALAVIALFGGNP